MDITLTDSYGIAVYPPGAAFGPRKMQDYEFVVIIEGECSYHHDGKAIDGPAGSVILCKPGATDYFQWSRKSRTIHSYIHFHVNNITDDYPPTENWPVIRRLPDDDAFRPLFRHLLNGIGKVAPAISESTVKELVNIFLFGQFSEAPADHKVWPSAVEDAFAHLYRIIDSDPSTPVSPGELAYAVNISQSHLCRLFKSTLGRTTIEVIRLVRLDYASHLLVRSNYTISEISAICGYSDQFNFSHVFKKVYSITPSEARKHGVRVSPLVLRRTR